MRKGFQITYTSFLLSLLTVFSFGRDSILGEEYKNPERFEKDIVNFETKDKVNPPEQGAIVCIGSSSMRGWHKTINDDLSPLTIIPRGFGGSNMNDALFYMDRIVLPYKPRAIVLYEGDNDIAQGITPSNIRNTFREFVEKVHYQLPECRIYVLSIKPSIKRWNMWERMKEANTLLAIECTKNKLLNFVDVASVMLDKDGNPIKEIFKDDNLHMTSKGYKAWTNVLKPILEEKELKFEPKL